MLPLDEISFLPRLLYQFQSVRLCTTELIHKVTASGPSLLHANLIMIARMFVKKIQKFYRKRFLTGGRCDVERFRLGVIPT